MYARIRILVHGQHSTRLHYLLEIRELNLSVQRQKKKTKREKEIDRVEQETQCVSLVYFSMSVRCEHTRIVQVHS